MSEQQEAIVPESNSSDVCRNREKHTYRKKSFEKIL